MASEKFELNPGQQKVFNHKSGPLLVVAGAGTGKTRTIVEKINQLLDDGVDPSAILAVTFTEKAASEMLERILLSRPGFVTEMAISTFNGCGDRILREFGVHIGLSSSFKLLSEPARIVFFRERIDEFKLDYFLPLSGMPDGVIADILSYFSQLKQNLITPEIYKKYANELKPDDEASSMDKIQHLELSQAYDAYHRLCREANVVDYDDQIYLAIQLLEQRPNVRRELQNRYHTLFIDEFQDTNPMQSKLIDLLVNENKNIIVVGDDDQAIYGWRGATLENILSFKDRYPGTKEAALTINYRSTQPILDSAYSLIKNNDPHRLEASLGINKKLESNKQGPPPELKRFVDSSQELDWIASDIAERLNELEDNENVSIAVLTRSNPSAAKVHDALDRAGVPHKVVGLSPDLYTRPIIRMLLELVRTLAEQDNSVSLHHTLVSDLFGISNSVVAPFALQARREHELLETILAECGDEQIIQAIALITSWRSYAASLPVGRLLWKAIDESGYKTRLLEDAMKDDDAAASVQHLKQFFDTLREFESIAVQPTATQYLMSLPALQSAGEISDDTMDIASNEVVVSTIHKSKGLEWDTVYVPKLMDRSFPYLGGVSGLKIPDELSAVSKSPADERLAEERRLMYVAATRAKRNLILSYYDLGPSGKAQKPSRFINELLGEGTSETTPYTEIDLVSSNLSLADDKVIKHEIPSSIYSSGNVRLSVSQAAALLNCPLNFYYKFVLNAPEAPTSSTTYGSQLHGLFEKMNRARQQGNLPPISEYLSELEAGWSRAGYVSKDQANKALIQAKNTLERFYENCGKNPPALKIEEKFEVNLQPENITLHGRMDIVLQSEKGPEIRDYKTGLSVQSEDSAKKRAGASKQLTMYALAWQELHGVIPRVSLEFVDSGLIGGVSKTQRGLDTLRSNLFKAVQDLKEGKFPAGTFRHNHCIHPPIGED